MSGENTISDVVDKGADVAKTYSNKEQGTRRLEIDMLSDTPLSKNIRPIIAIWALSLLTILIVLNCLHFTFPKDVTETIFWLIIIVMGFYFPGRTAEKWMKKRRDK